MTAYDIYAYAYPMFLRGADAIRHSGAGLLWNADQNCGQPFFGIGTTGLLYPPSWLFLALPGDRGLYALLLCNLLIAAFGAYGLGRQLGASRPAAVCGGLTFALSNQGIDVLTYTPVVGGPYAWLPVAMLCAERLLLIGSLSRALALAAALAFALLPGHPQVVVYLYQLIALRVVWEVATERSSRTSQFIRTFGLAFVVAPLFAAVQFVPAVESMRLSVRSSSLAAHEILPVGSYGLRDFVALFATRADINNPLHLLPPLLACGVLVSRGARRHAAFYALAGVGSLFLALGDNGVLYPLYRLLPAGSLFREPVRFLWITALCMSVLVALGTHALTHDLALAPLRRRMAVVTLPVVTLVAMWWLSARGLSAHEIWLAAAIVGSVLATACAPRLASVASAVCAAALVLDLAWMRSPPSRRLLPDGMALFARQRLFERVAAETSPNDRVFLVPSFVDYTLQHKTGSLFGVPMVSDYESQPSRRWAEYMTRLRTGRSMQSINDVQFPPQGLPSDASRPLIDLTASRFVIVGFHPDPIPQLSGPPLVLRGAFEDALLYENSDAVPRASWVPRAEVVSDPATLLEMLAERRVDPREVVLIESVPPTGLGTQSAPGGEVSFVRNDPEYVEVRVNAAAPGFLVLADQYFPGWTATVNGAETPILRANYAFRAVPVPEGTSEVTFRYDPRSLVLGGAISAVTIGAALVGLLWVSRTRSAVGSGTSAGGMGIPNGDL